VRENGDGSPLEFVLTRSECKKDYAESILPKLRLRTRREVQGKASMRGRRVLVVEDEAVVALMIVDLLVQAECIVIGPAATTGSALDLIEREAFDCAVLDVKLLDGQVFPVADALAARGVPFLFATGYQSDTLGARYAEVPRIEKVYDCADLLDALAGLLESKPRAA